MELKKTLKGGFWLVSATMAANILNFVFSVYLGRALSLDEFGELSLFTSLLYFTSIPLGSFSSTISHNIGYLYGKKSQAHAQGYLKYIFSKSIIFGIILSILWAALTPVLSKFFQTGFTPILLFAPLWFISVASSNFSGYLAGTLSFGKKGLVLVSEAASRLAIALLFVFTGLSELVFVSILLSQTISVVLSWLLVREKNVKTLSLEDKKFNYFFLFTSTLTGISNITFLTLDVILVKHFLSPDAAGQYGLLSLIGKMTYFLGSLFIPFMIPIISHNQGAKKDSKNTFAFLFLTTLIFCLGSFIGLGLLGAIFVPFIFGPKTIAIIPLLSPYVLAMAIFTATQPVVAYFQAKENYSFAVVGFLVAIVQIVLTTLFHKDLYQIVYVMLTTSSLNLGFTILLYLLGNRVQTFNQNIKKSFKQVNNYLQAIKFI